MVEDETGEIQQSIEDIPTNNCFQGQHAAQFSFCSYEALLLCN